MTALQIASEHCANHRDGGRCQKIVIQDDGSLVRRPSMPDFCTMGKKGIRCDYFDECVAPNNRRYEGMARREFDDAVAEYRRAANVENPNWGRICSCGKALDKGKRLCSDCKMERRRQANRRKNEKRGIRVHHETPKVQKMHTDNQQVATAKNPNLPGVVEDSGQGQNGNLRCTP